MAIIKLETMKREPLVSIITPFYNVEEFLQEAVESVINQSYKNWELLLVDDGSTDNSSSMARDIAIRYSNKITYLSHGNYKNKGVSASRNLGLSKANGELVAFLDADDIWFSKKLAHQIKIMNNHQAVDMVCGSTLYWNSWVDNSKPDELVKIKCNQNTIFEPTELSTILYPLGRACAPSMNGLLIKRPVIDKVGGFVDEFICMYDDQAFLSKIYLYASVYITEECYDKYRQRPESICGTVQKDGSYHAFRRYFLNWFKDYLNKNNIHIKEVEEALNRNLIKYERPNYYKMFQLQKKIKRLAKSKIDVMGEIFKQG
ncbi:MAG: glycosyltransferase family 2 protein [Balneolales bacterium]